MVDDPIKAKSKKGLARRLTEGVLLTGAIFVAYSVFSGPSLRVEQTRFGTKITNVGGSELVIKNVIVNGRGECGPMEFGDQPFRPQRIKVGEFWMFVSRCSEVVRVEVQTSDGTGTYRF